MLQHKETTILYDMMGKQISDRYIKFVCGRIADMNKHKYYYSSAQKRYYAYCNVCKVSEWIEAFTCIGCQETNPNCSSTFPIHCVHKKKRCVAKTHKSMDCKNYARPNNDGCCVVHNNSKIRLQCATRVCSCLDLLLCEDVQFTILDYVVEA